MSNHIWKREIAVGDRVTYHAIKCFTCDKVLPSRAYLRQHMGHSVHYIDKDGKIDE